MKNLSLPESCSLPSARRFAECFLLGTRQRILCCRSLGKEFFAKCRTRQSYTLSNIPVYREYDTQYRLTLGKDLFAGCPTLGKRRPSTKGHQQPSITDGHYLCQAPGISTRQTMLCRVSTLDTRQTIFLFFPFSNQTFCGLFLHYVDLHVPFWHNYKNVCYNY
jgi:hypothetical protein